MTHPPQVLTEPPTDCPAAADPVTVRALYRLRRTSLVACAVLAAVLLGFPLAAVLTHDSSLRVGLIVGSVVAWLLTLLRSWPRLLRRTGWVRGMQRAAGTMSWRKVPAMLIRGGPKTVDPVIALQDGSGYRLLQVRAAAWPVQLTIARTGSVWLLGPDVGGRMAVMAEGLRVPLQAARIEQPPAGEPPAMPVVRPGGTAATDPVSDAMLRFLVRTVVVYIVMFGLLGLLGLVNLSASFGLGWAGASLALLGWWLWSTRHVWSVRTQLARGPWTPVAAQLDPWPASTRSTVKLTGQIQLGDGRVLTVELPRATESLVANVAASGRLWFAGQPSGGQTCAVGVPGTPVLGLARVR